MREDTKNRHNFLQVSDYKMWNKRYENFSEPNFERKVDFLIVENKKYFYSFFPWSQTPIIGIVTLNQGSA